MTHCSSPTGTNSSIRTGSSASARPTPKGRPPTPSRRTVRVAPGRARGLPGRERPPLRTPALSVRTPERVAPSGVSSRHTGPTAGRNCGPTPRAGCTGSRSARATASATTRTWSSAGAPFRQRDGRDARHRRRSSRMERGGAGGGRATRWSSARRSGRSSSTASCTGCVRRGTQLSAVQYVRGDETAALAWLPSQRYGERPSRLRLRGLDPRRSTRPGHGRRHRGAVPLHHGLHTGLRGDLDARALRCRRV